MVEALRETLRDLHLHDVAVGDVALRFRDRRVKGVLADVGAGGLDRPRRGVRRKLRLVAQSRTQPLQLAIALDEGAGVRRVDIDEEMQLPRQVVDDRKLLGEQQPDVGQSERIGLRGAGEPFLDVAHRVVAEIADEPAGEAQPRFERRGAKRTEVIVDVRERIVDLAALDSEPVALEHHFAAARFEHLARRQAHDRVAPEALAADHRLEQVGARPVGELQVDGQRRVEIREGLEVERDAVMAGAGERLEFVFCHGSLHVSVRKWRMGRARLPPALPSPSEMKFA